MKENKKTRILLSSPLEGKIGGISRWTRHIMQYYSTNKDRVNVVIDQYYPYGKDNKSSLKLIRVCSGIFKYLPYLQILRKKVMSSHYDIIHFVSSASFSLVRDFLALRISKSYKIQTVIHFRFGRIPDLYNKKNWEQKLLEKVINLADKVIVIDHKSYDVLLKNGHDNIVFLPNPLTPKVNKIIHNNSAIDREYRKILFAGHNVPAKGVFELINACREIPNVKLKMIGYVTPAMKRKMFDEAGEGFDKWLEIAGEKDFETTIKEMLSASVFVLPTYTEGFPNVIIEAMACGCPIVTTNVGAIPEMLDIKNGFYNGITIEPQNVNELKNAIIMMLEDKNYAIQCGKNAQERVNIMYSMPIVWKQLEEIWTKLPIK